MFVINSINYFFFLYPGPLLDANSDIFKVEIGKSKEKQALMKIMMETLSAMYPSQNYIKTDVNRNLGFLIGKFDF